ncbi:MAG: UDP-glucose 4-epimerase GalE [Pelagibacteraceae bacterium TMED287]|nr:MAG: UDP-glucose 4-epimerase GalE [Pelagibacteraceae bacterium TMED287]
MQNILITGGAGYIGSHITEILIKNNYTVFIVDNLSTGYKKLINKKAFFYKEDIRNKTKIKKIILNNSIDSVIHLAALLDVNESQKNPKKYISNNIKGTKNLLEAIKNSSVKNLIFSSTAAVYKDGIYKVSEKTSLKPKSVYGKTKLSSEYLIKKFSKNNKINYAILRYFNVVGAANSGKIGQINKYDLLFKNLSISLMKKLPSINIYGNDYKTFDKTCIRDFIHVSDISNIHIKVLSKINKTNKSLILNCGYGIGISVLQVVNAFQKFSKKRIKIFYKPRRKADLAAIIANNNKLKKLIKWKPKFNNLSVMVKSSINWEKKLKKF